MTAERETPRIEKLFTKKQAGSALVVSVETIDRLRKSGALRSLKVGGQVRFRESELVKFIEESSSCR